MKTRNDIQSVRKAMELLCLFTHGFPSLGIKEISAMLNLPKGTVHGFARTLLNTGFLQQNPETRKYQIGMRIYELGAILAGTLDVNQKATRPVQELAKRTRLVCHIAIWDGDSALVTLNVDPRFNPKSVYQMGPRVSAHCSAVGKALLAYLQPQEIKTYLEQCKLARYTSKTIIRKEQLLKELEEVRLRGYAIDREETMLGLTCIGAPILGRGGLLVGSISLSGSSDRILGKQKTGLIKELLETAGEISRSVGYSLASLELPPPQKSGKSRRDEVEGGFPFLRRPS